MTERISAGLPAAGPLSEQERARVGTSLEVHLRTIAQSSHEGGVTTINDEGAVLDKALEDPAAVKVLQELVIKTMTQ